MLCTTWSGKSHYGKLMCCFPRVAARALKKTLAGLKPLKDPPARARRSGYFSAQFRVFARNLRDRRRQMFFCTKKKRNLCFFSCFTGPLGGANTLLVFDTRMSVFLRLVLSLTRVCACSFLSPPNRCWIRDSCGRKCLVVGADALSRWVDWEDRNSCILFGDGAGAMVLEAAEDSSDSGVLGQRPQC